MGGIMLIVLVVLIIIGLVAPNIMAVPQGHVAIITQFGKYHKIMHAGLNVKAPWQRRYMRLSLQNRTMNLDFQAITFDQANVYFKATLIYSVTKDNNEQTYKNAAFAFNSPQEFMLAIQKQVESEVRAFISTKKQDEILGVRQEIASVVKEYVDNKIEEWGYTLHDIQITDLRFDQEITESMAKVVASSNLRKAAENEGAALLIKKTKQAEAEGAFIRIQAESEKEAWKLKGEGLASFREEVSRGIKISVEELKSADIDPTYVLYFMYNETLKEIAEKGKGKTIFIDSGVSAVDRFMQQFTGLIDFSVAGSQSQKDVKDVKPLPNTDETAIPETKPEDGYTF